MTCENTYTVCGPDCGFFELPAKGTETGNFWLQWEYDGSTYRKLIQITFWQPIRFLWPFQSYGVFNFQILDLELNPVSFEVEDVVYECWKAIGIPSYDIDPEELAELLEMCDNPLDEELYELQGSGTLEVEEWEQEPPGGDFDWELEADLEGRGDLQMIDVEAEDPVEPPDHELEGDMDGRGDVQIESVLLGDPPGFAYLLNGEDLVMQAFGFRRLNPGWTGACCEVERWTDGATKVIGWNAGWRDDEEMADFLKGAPAGIRRWYNQQGPGGDYFQPSQLLQLQVADAGGPLKKIINLQSFPTCYGNGFTFFPGAGVGPWNGTVHSWHMVVHSEAPFHAVDPSGSGYFGYGILFPTPHHANAGSPVYWVNNVFQLNDLGNAYSAVTFNLDTHIWMDSLDLSTWGQTSVPPSFEGYLFEIVFFNENKASERVAKTALTMPIFGL